MARWSSHTISLGFRALTALCIGLLGWNIALQVQVSFKSGVLPLEIVATRSLILQMRSTNLTYVTASSGDVDINSGSFLAIAAITIQTRQNGEEILQLYTFFNFPFNGTATGTDFIYIDFEIPTSFLGTSIDLNFSALSTIGATGSVDPTFVIAKGFHPQSYEVANYPPNWMRLSCIPLSGAATQTYTSMTMLITAATP